MQRNAVRSLARCGVRASLGKTNSLLAAESLLTNGMAKTTSSRMLATHVSQQVGGKQYHTDDGADPVVLLKGCSRMELSVKPLFKQLLSELAREATDDETVDEQLEDIVATVGNIKMERQTRKHIASMTERYGGSGVRDQMMDKQKDQFLSLLSSVTTLERDQKSLRVDLLFKTLKPQHVGKEAKVAVAYKDGWHLAVTLPHDRLANSGGNALEHLREFLGVESWICDASGNDSLARFIFEAADRDFVFRKKKGYEDDDDDGYNDEDDEDEDDDNGQSKRRVPEFKDKLVVAPIPTPTPPTPTPAPPQQAREERQVVHEEIVVTS